MSCTIDFQVGLYKARWIWDHNMKSILSMEAICSNIGQIIYGIYNVDSTWLSQICRKIQDWKTAVNLSICYWGQWWCICTLRENWFLIYWGDMGIFKEQGTPLLDWWRQMVGWPKFSTQFCLIQIKLFSPSLLLYLRSISISVNFMLCIMRKTQSQLYCLCISGWISESYAKVVGQLRVE